MSPSSLLFNKYKKNMIRQVIDFIKAYINGEEAELNLTAEFSWWEVGAILIIIGLIIWIICK